MILDCQDNVSKFFLRVTPRLLCGSPRKKYSNGYAELRGVTRRRRGDARRKAYNRGETGIMNWKFSL